MTASQTIDLVKQAVMLGMIQYQAMIQPESNKVKQREVWRWLKQLGIPRSVLDQWVDAGMVKRHKDTGKGGNAAVWYWKTEIQSAIVAQNVNNDND